MTCIQVMKFQACATHNENLVVCLFRDSETRYVQDHLGSDHTIASYIRHNFLSVVMFKCAMYNKRKWDPLYALPRICYWYKYKYPVYLPLNLQNSIFEENRCCCFIHFLTLPLHWLMWEPPLSTYPSLSVISAWLNHWETSWNYSVIMTPKTRSLYYKFLLSLYQSAVFQTHCATFSGISTIA